jgi:hypothetical protein
MKTQRTQTTATARRTLVIVGGKGGLEPRYRDVADQYGYELKFYEQRTPSKSRPLPSSIALVIVIVSMVSHPLMHHARRLASDGTTIVYQRSASPSALHESLDQVLRGSDRSGNAKQQIRT